MHSHRVDAGKGSQAPAARALLALTRFRSRSVIADHLHTDAVTEITFTTSSPGFSGFPSWGQVVGRQHRAVAITPTFLEQS